MLLRPPVPRRDVPALRTLRTTPRTTMTATLALIVLAAIPGWWAPRAQLVADTITSNPCRTTIRWVAPQPTDPPGGWVAYHPPGTCEVWLNNGVPFDWARYCTAVIHETGHVVGWQHSPNPRSVMHPSPQPDRRCDQRGRPYLDGRGVTR